nr:MAG TPA: hypothetical protein [Caudoviricetes sp.]
MKITLNILLSMLSFKNFCVIMAMRITVGICWKK